MAVVGIDACRKGWFAVRIDDSGAVTGHFLATLDGVADLGPVEGVGIDIPLGLARDSIRDADLAAKAILGPRRSSIFVTPVRDALVAETHAEASAINRERTGKGISVQAYGLRAKVLEADTWVVAAGLPVWEVHPEVSFTLLRDGIPAVSPKTTWAGQQERRDALTHAGLDLAAIDPRAGAMAAADDVLDAAAVAWSTRRLVAGEGISLPAEPERYDGWPFPVAIFG